MLEGISISMQEDKMKAKYLIQLVLCDTKAAGESESITRINDEKESIL